MCMQSADRFPVLILAAGLLLASCVEEIVPSKRGSREPEDPTSSFVNQVWVVRESASLAPGQQYVFLSEGTLLITSPSGTPALGSWTYKGGELTMVEEGLPYKVDILKLTPHEFKIRINNPGEPVEMRLVPADRPAVQN